jgi:DNA-binding protein H-NS
MNPRLASAIAGWDTYRIIVLSLASPVNGNQIYSRGGMQKFDLNKMQLDELWDLYEELTELLSVRIISEKRQLEMRLARLNHTGGAGNLLPSTSRTPRRAYPKVLPKYFNPKSSSETWSGRGKQPRWLTAALKSGHKLQEFEVGRAKEISR